MESSGTMPGESNTAVTPTRVNVHEFPSPNVALNPLGPGRPKYWGRSGRNQRSFLVDSASASSESTLVDMIGIYVYDNGTK